MYSIKTVLASAVLLTLLSAASTRAENPDHRRQLLQTNSCENCDLSGANLGGFDLREANLQGANLSNATLLTTSLIRANLQGADLSNAILFSTNLTGANLQNANLSNAQSLHICQLESNEPEDITDCVGEWLKIRLGNELCDPAYGSSSENLAQLMGEDSTFCEVENQASLLFQYVPYANLVTQLILQGANLSGANLSGAHLLGADLRYANLTGAQAMDADFRHALLIEAITTDLQSADLSQAWLTKSELGTWLVENYQSAAMQARAAEGKTYVGAMNRSQQAYHLEMGEFSDNLEALGLGIDPETDTYRYGIVKPAEPTQWVINYGISKTEELYSYIGVTYLTQTEFNEPITGTILCQSTTPDIMAVTDLPDIPGSPLPMCPENWQQL